MRSPISIALAVLLASPPLWAQTPQNVSVQPTLETQGVVASGSVVGGAAVWVNPLDLSKSQLLVADNQTGLLIYNPDGGVRTAISEGAVQSVDVQEGILPGDGGTIPLIMVVNVTSGLVSYAMDPVTLNVRNAGYASIFPQDFTPNSVALYTSPSTGRLYAFAGSSTGTLAQFDLSNPDGGISNTPVRTLAVGGAVVGMTVDDVQSKLYVAVQNVGIWQYGAEPTAGDARVSVDNSKAGGGLVNPLGGLALYTGVGTDGYLLAASGGDDAVRVYQRNPAAHTRVGTFSLTANGAIDVVDNPRLLAVTNRPMGSAFASGMVAVHDSSNTGGTENFKLVPWLTVASAFEPDLITNTGPSNPTDGGVGDGGPGGGPDSGVVPDPPTGPDNPIEGQPDDKCGCTASSVPGTVLLVLMGMLLSRRRHET